MKSIKELSLRNMSPYSLRSISLKRVRNYKASWNSPGILERSQLFPACLPLAGEAETGLFTDETVSAEVELYGGPGVGGNAGGVRCANYGGYQVKGVGQTILAGLETDKWHKHGALSLQDGIKEAILASLFDTASPFGAVRTHAVIDLGVHFGTEVGEEKLPGSAPRALMFRDECVRLACYMRSSYSNAGHGLKGQDVLRMTDGVSKFVNFFSEGINLGRPDSLIEGLVNLYRKHMYQSAVLRTKRLVHGSAIPSNYTIDGKMLDFTTATTISTLHPVLVTPGGCSSLEQHRQIIDTVDDIVFYICKFDERFKVDKAEIRRISSEIKSALHLAFHEYLLHEHIKLFGFTEIEIKKFSPSIKSALFSALIGVIRQGSVNGHLYYGGDEHAMLAQRGCDDIFPPIAMAISGRGTLTIPLTICYSPISECFSAESIRNLCLAYNMAANCLSETSESRSVAAARIFRAMRLCADLSALYRRNLDGAISEICIAGGDFPAFINQTIASNRNIFGSSFDGGVELKGWVTHGSYTVYNDHVVIPTGEIVDIFDIYQAPIAENISRRHKWLLEFLQSNRRD